VQIGVGKGLIFLVDPRFELGYMRGDYEPWVQELLLRWLHPGDVFYDVGAHTGFFSLIASRLIGRDGVVFAFEPDPENFARLVGNVAENKAQSVNPVSAVVWSQSGTARFARATSASSRVEGRAVTQEAVPETLMLPAVRLDDYYDLRPGVAKVDVEGGELSVLEGARQLLAAGNLRWIVEAHSEELEESVVRILRYAQYRVEAIHSKVATHTGYLKNYVVATRE